MERAFERCESCCLDNQADRERLAEALQEEMRAEVPTIEEGIAKAWKDIESMMVPR
jgi:hypothetical protein